MFRYLINLLVIVSLFPGTSFGVAINGQLKNAQMEKSASNPVANIVESRFYYNTTSKKPLIYNGVSWAELGGSTGSGEKNYITNPSAATDTTGWTCVGDLAVTRTNTLADLPREFTTATGLKIIADADVQSVADYCYFDFSLDDIDQSKKLKIQWAQKQTGTYVASDLAVVITTQADRTTALHTPETTNVPASDYVFQTSFDTSTTATLSVVIRATTDMATSGGLVFSDVIVGPGTVVNVAAIGPWIAYTPTTANTGSKTFVNTAFYRRVADSMEIVYLLNGNTTASGSATATTVTVTIPTGFTIDASKDVGSLTYGAYTSYGIETAATYDIGYAYGNNTTTFRFGSTDGAGDITLGDLNVARDMDIEGRITIPIAEWAGSPNYSGSNDVEYASVGGTWDAASTTSVYGPQGSLMGGALTAARAKTITWQTAIQSGDAFLVQVATSTSGPWAPLDGYTDGSTYSIITALSTVGSGNTGSGTSMRHSSSTQTVLTFFRYSSIANDDSPVTEWPSDLYWRVVKSKSGQAVGFGAATDTASGLVSKETSGSFTMTATGFTTTPTCNGYYTRVGNIVTIVMDADVLATSNATSFTLTGMPSILYPARTTDGSITNLRDNTGSYVAGSYRISTAGVITLYLLGRGSFTAAGTKGVLQNSFTYYVD